MIQEEECPLQVKRSNMLFENNFNSQEGRLLEDAFLLSSSIEIFTTKPKDQNQISQKELSIFTDLSDFMKKLQTADEYRRQEQTQFMLQPEGFGLLATVATLGEEGLSDSIRNALSTLDKMTTEREIPVGNQQSVKDLISLLRRLLNGIKVKMSQEDESQDRFTTS